MSHSQNVASGVAPTSRTDTSDGGPGASLLTALADEYWELRLAADPVEATLLGDRRFDDRMPDLTRAANDQQRTRLQSLLARVRAFAGDQTVTDDEAVTLAALAGEIEADIALRTCRLGEWAVDPRDGPQVAYMTLGQLQTVVNPDQGAAMLARWQKLPQDLEQRGQNLLKAKSEGRLATRGAVERVVRQLDDLLGHPTATWALAAPARAPLEAWPAQNRDAFRTAVLKAVESNIRPAFVAYRELLVRDILPHARGDDAVGLLRVPEGPACYQRLIKIHTSLDLSAEQIHAIGLREVARVRADMQRLGVKLFGTTDISAVQRRLRDDPALYFDSREQVETKAREALNRAQAALPAWVGHLPRTGCEVKRVEAFEEKDTTIAYYRQPAVDGSRPGTYYVNTYEPRSRPRFEAEVLAFHESVPGHHTQIALAQEMTGLPEFRKHLGVTAYVEGWALYTERLADEMNLYSSDLDRMGMLSFDAWRACRLVVDTGLHALGWTRAQAIAYMTENTALAPNNIDNEVDRYIGWPGQALAYKLGQLEIQRLRADAQARLGARFDLRSFHDAVLGHGAVSLKVLDGVVDRWVATHQHL